MYSDAKYLASSLKIVFGPGTGKDSSTSCDQVTCLAVRFVSANKSLPWKNDRVIPILVFKSQVPRPLGFTPLLDFPQ